jgi:hypothetical protein
MLVFVDLSYDNLSFCYGKLLVLKNVSFRGLKFLLWYTLKGKGKDILDSFLGKMILFHLKKKIYLIYFMVQIKYCRFNSVQTITLFKILNDVTVCILLDSENKI